MLNNIYIQLKKTFFFEYRQRLIIFAFECLSILPQILINVEITYPDFWITQRPNNNYNLDKNIIGYNTRRVNNRMIIVNL